MRKKCLALFLALCLMLALLPAQVFAASPGNSVGQEKTKIDAGDWDLSDVYTDSGTATISRSQQSAAASGRSGASSINKLTKQEIARLLIDNPLTMPEVVFDQQPSTKAPYATGKLSTAAQQAATNRLNALRRIAGLPDVKLDSAWSELAQYGAVLLAASSFGHYPPKPSDMSQSFYDKGLTATSSSNLYGGVQLLTAVDGFMDDSDATNVDRLGHRRWQLGPARTKVGFGYTSEGGYYGRYVDERVFEKGEKAKTQISYDFISWPASGNFPNTLFRSHVAWSVSLNPSTYAVPKMSEVKVTLTRKSDGESWSFSGNKTYSKSSSGEYFNIDTDAYGDVPICIIFRPGGIRTYEGVYSVSITGLHLKNGKSTSLSFDVDFFNPDDIELEFRPEMFSVNTGAEVYDGSAKTKSISGRSNGTALVADRDYTVSYSDNVNAGTATVLVRAKWPYIGEAEFHFPIYKAARDLDVKIERERTTLFLDGSSGGLSVSGDNAKAEEPSYQFSSGDEKIVSVTEGGEVRPTGLGTASVVVSAPETANYAAASVGISFTVTEAPLQELSFSQTGALSRSVGDEKFVNAASNRSAGGGAIHYSSSDELVAVVNETSGEVTPVGVGSAVITATAAAVPDQYGRTEANYTLTVTPRTLTIAGVTLNERGYDSTNVAEVREVRFDGLPAGESLTLGVDYTVDARYDGLDAGEHVVTVEVDMLNENYRLSSSTYQTTGVIKKAVPFHLSGETALRVREGSSVTVDLYSVPGWPRDQDRDTRQFSLVQTDFKGLSAAVSGSTLILTSKGNAEDDSRETVTVRVSGMYNFEDSFLDIEVRHIVRTPVDISGVTLPSRSYTGAAVSLSGTPVTRLSDTGESVDLRGQLVTSWQSVIREYDYVEIEGAPKDVGEYRCIIRVADDSDYAGELIIPFAITEATLVASPERVTLRSGEKMPSSFALSYSGFVAGEGPEVLFHGGEEPEFRILDGSTPYDGDVGVTGSYTVEWTNKDAVHLSAMNYRVVKQDGLLTVTSRLPQVPQSTPSSPSGSLYPTGRFRDVSARDWYSEAVGYMLATGLMNGTSDTTFSPNRTTTRGMIVTILYRLDGSPDVSASSGFRDVSSNMYYAKAVRWAQENGIVQGYGDGTFGPERPITREQLATFLYRYAVYCWLDTGGTASLRGYRDGYRVSGFAEEAVRWAVGSGLIEGDDTLALNPTGYATRAQAATILMRFCKNFA